MNDPVGGVEAQPENSRGIVRLVISDDALAAMDWQGDIRDLDGPYHRWDHVVRIKRRADDIAEADPQFSAVLQLLSAVISMHMVVNTSTPFTAAMQLSNGRSASPEDLDLNDLDILKRMAAEARTPWLRARLADVGLNVSQDLGEPNWTLGALAAHAYLEHAGLEGVAHDIDRRESLERAMELGWRYLRRDEEYHTRLWNVAMELLRAGLAESKPGLSVPIAHQLKSRNRALVSEAAALFEQQAETLVAAGATPLAADTFREAAQLWHAAKDDVRAQAAHHRTADVFVMLARGPGQAMLQADWMAEGIAILRRQRGDRTAIRELQAELVEIRSRIIGEMSRISHPIDVSELVAHVEARMNAENLPDALLELAFAFAEWTKADHARSRVIENAGRYIFSNMFRRVTYNANGVPSDVTEPFDAANEEELEKRVIQQVAQYEHPLLARVAIARAVDILQTRFEPTMADMIQMLHESPVTPRGHEWSLARGLLAGLNHDWHEAAVFLIPQAEPFVRAAFRRRGLHTLSNNTTTPGAEEEKSLNELLAHPEVHSVLSADIVLELKTLLTDKAGHNLRNLYGHGLIEDENLANVGTIVLWWTMLRLVLWPYRGRAVELIKQADAKKATENGGEQSTSPDEEE